MAATVTAQPAQYAAAYRPMRITVERTDPAGSQVGFVKVADASDVSTYSGSGLEVGDIFLQHATISGSVPAVVGQTILIYQGCGDYNGVWTITKAFTDSGDTYVVIDAPDYGNVTPVSPIGLMRVWLNNWTVFLRIAIYTDPAGTPQYVDLDGPPDTDVNLVHFDVGNHLRDYFRNDNLWVYGLAVGGGELVQSAHGITGLLYRVHIAEAYDQPSGEPMEPFDGTHDILVDDVEDPLTFRSVVNARHPYAEWSTTNLADYVVGSTSFVRKFLTDAPRALLGSTQCIALTMQATDRFRAHILTPGESQAGNDPWAVGYRLIVKPVVAGSPGTTLLDQALTLTGSHAAFSVAVGPADLAPFITVPDEYVAYIQNVALSASMSEPVWVKVESKCSESEVPIITLNPLGGVDHYTLRGRLIETTDAGRSRYTLSTKPLGKEVRRWLASLWTKRGPVATLQKPYSAGTGFDWQERAYKGTLAVQRISDTRCAPIIIDSDAVVFNSGPNYKPITLEYSMGVDLISQQG